MFNLGWSEIFFIMLVGIVVIGPDEIPGIMRNLGRVARRLHYLKFAMSRQFEDFMKEHDLNEIKDLGSDVNFEAPRFDGRDFDEAEADAEEDLPLEPPAGEAKNE